MQTEYIKQDKALVVRISEEIDQDTVDKIKRKIDDEIEKYIPKKVIFDFEDITFMDSSGIGMVLGRYKLIKLIGGDMEIVNVSKTVNRIFKMSGIGRIIPIMLKDEEIKNAENDPNAKSNLNFKEENIEAESKSTKFDSEEEARNEGSMW